MQNKDAELGKIFKLLKEWYDFPNYQLERRVDIFFAHFMLDILNDNDLRDKDIVRIIPEFPLWAEREPNGKATRHSKKVDYTVIDKGASTVYFIELKTTDKSIKDSVKNYEKPQVERMAELCDKDWYDLLADALFICNCNNDYRKLRESLWDIMSIDKQEAEKLYNEPDINNWRKKVKKLSNPDSSKKWLRKSVYIIPEKSTQEGCLGKTPYYNKYLKKYDTDILNGKGVITVITFSDVISALKKVNTPLSKEFREFLGNLIGVI